jgi:hypothetical protein
MCLRSPSVLPGAAEGAEVVLWIEGSNHQDDTIGLLEKIIATAAVMVVLLGGRWLPLEIAALALALWLPSADRFERGPRG